MFTKKKKGYIKWLTQLMMPSSVRRSRRFLCSARTSSLREYASGSVLSGAQTTKVCLVGRTFESVPPALDAILLINSGWGEGVAVLRREIAIKARCAAGGMTSLSVLSMHGHRPTIRSKTKTALPYKIVCKSQPDP
jgi:hypothetical protein